MKSLMPGRAHPGLLTLLLSILFFSCQKDQSIRSVSDPDTQEDFTSISELPQELRHGRLVFNSFTHFWEVTSLISGLSDQVLDRWEEQIGFNSDRKFIAGVRNEYENLETKEDLDAFLYRNEGQILFDEGSIQGKQLWRHLSALIPREGDEWMYIGNDLYRFMEDRQLIIVGGDEEKIAFAERRVTSDHDQGIYVFYQPNKGPEIPGSRNCTEFCTEYLYMWEDKDSDNDKRLRYWWGGGSSYELLPNGNFNTHYAFYRKIESKKKSGFIWKRTWIDVAIDHFAAFCYANCNVPSDDVSFSETILAVADYENSTELLLLEDQVGGCQLLHVIIDTSADRIESPNTNDLQVNINHDCS